MDQLCIDQGNVAEKNQEVPKMRQYYNNAMVTLISINKDIRKKDSNILPPSLDILEAVVNSQ